MVRKTIAMVGKTIVDGWMMAMVGMIGERSGRMFEEG
jgi:hypothetical protein